MNASADADLLQAMQAMIESQNWQAYLRFRRSYITNGGKQSAIKKMVQTLSDDAQLAYGRYFNISKEISHHIREILIKEAALKQANQQAERQAAYEQRQNNRA